MNDAAPWPTAAEIDAMPDDILRQWYWQPIAAQTPAQQSLIRRAASRLFSPPKIAPVYLPLPAQDDAHGPRRELQKPAPKITPKAKPEEPAEQSSLDIFKSLFRKP